MSRRFTTRRKLAAGLAGVLTIAGLAWMGSPTTATADTAPLDPDDPKTPLTVSNDPLPTPQINGVAWVTATVGNTVYVGGSFTNARPAGSNPGQNTVARSNILAFNLTTGALLPFAPTLNQQVRAFAVSPDQTRLYVGGEFTTVNGTTRRRIAAFNIANGALVSGFAPSVNYDVSAVVATNTTVYAGGDFLGVGSQNREHLAAFNASNGALLDWAPQATGGAVNAMAINPDGSKIVVGGSFTALNGSNNPGYGLGMVDAVTGASLPYAVNSVVRNGTADGAITALTSDGTYVYGGGYTFGRSGGTWEGTFAASWEGGAIHWLNDCHGDTYDVQPIGDVIYSVGHTHYCENIDGPRQGAGGVGSYPYYRGTATGRAATGTVKWEPDQGRYYSFLGQPAPSYLGWYPEINAGTYTGQSQGPWTATGSSDYLVLGGEFTRVNGVNQQGLVRFARPGLAPNDEGPELFNTTWPLNVSSTEAGTARVNWSINDDSDNEYLTYRVYRDTQNAAGLIHTRSAESRFWNPYTMGITDTGLAPGSTHQYRVQAVDPWGNTANSPWTSVTVASSGTNSDYVEAVYADEPTDYWRFGEPSGTTAADRVGFLPLTTNAGVTRGVAGAIPTDSDLAARFNGTSTGFGVVGSTGNPPDVFTLETWFKTTTDRGGRLVGWSNRNTSNSNKHDRQLYMDNSGRIHFGVRPTNQRLVVTSPGTYRDGTWHHAVASLSPAGMKLYVDGVQVGSRTDVTVGEHLSIGYWRVGGDTLSGWPSQPASGFFAGDLDEVAIYKHELNAGDVAAHYAAGTGIPAPNLPPNADLETAITGLSVNVDGSGSTDDDGTITSYAWDFGDGATATGPTASHSYAAPGTYTVTLTVTDDDGATDTATAQVTVDFPPNVPPVAAFTTSTNQLALNVDGSGSSDDGTITAYDWTFGDGATATGPTASHTYAASGTYDVTLTVTDDDGAPTSLTKQVSVSTEPTPFALDAFGRTVSNGWGPADLGGTWTTGGTANYNVAGGVATLRMANPSSGPSVSLPGVSSSATEVRVSVGLDKAATGGGVHLTTRPRIVGTSSYFATTRFVSDGSVTLALGRTVSGTDTTLTTVVVPGLTVVPGDRLQLKVQATGTSPTILRAKVWRLGNTEPGGWTGTVNDSTAALQAAGAIGFLSYLSGSATNAPVTASFDDLWAGPTP